MKTEYLDVNKPKSTRKAFVQTPSRTEAIKICPWAQYLVKVEEGFKCFEDREEYIEFKEELKDERNK